MIHLPDKIITSAPHNQGQMFNVFQLTEYRFKLRHECKKVIVLFLCATIEQ